ncbi:hypothetical protein QUB80_28120 [Chlorogloeopsis sp. ULAP01]|uniref:hypothetical protein n=1 Tax=Chlorogloeopsis sp. ULAP01 TaxID=3056483 RepID=UPI0025AB2E2C|nr:hypothetical protein [Chlorogloeopsis sp. ULAP01]MDM9384538.1 hypothetical protein [Chlorogloeopsis sp. ULAP01]
MSQLLLIVNGKSQRRRINLNILTAITPNLSTSHTQRSPHLPPPPIAPGTAQTNRSPQPRASADHLMVFSEWSIVFIHECKSLVRSQLTIYYTETFYITTLYKVFIQTLSV